MATMEPPRTIPFIIHDDTTVLTLPRQQGGLMPCPISPYSCPQRLWWFPDFSEEAHFLMSLGLAALWLSRATSPHLAWARTGFTPLPRAGCLTLLLAATPSQEVVNPGRPPHGLQEDRKYEMPKTLEGRGCHLPASTLSQNGKGPGVTATDIQCQCYLHF